MPIEAPRRLSITESEDAPNAIALAGELLGLGRGEIVARLEATNFRLRRVLGLQRGPIHVLGDGLRVDDLAGLVRVSPGFELEVAPKFLGESWAGWREDYFLIATLSRYGRLLARDRLGAGYGDRGDLATLVGRSLIDEYWRHHRRPLRTYRRRVTRDFSLDGDVDPEELIVVDPDGFLQETVQFTRQNDFNATMHLAVSVLLPEVRDGETRNQLTRVRDALAPQMLRRRRRPRTVPSRHRRWQMLFELSEQVLAGFGVSLAEAAGLVGPGYVLRTSKAWEDVLVAALRIGIPEAQVRAQHPYPLGTRDGKPFFTRPDVTVERGGNVLLVDAKYKTRAAQANGRVTSADIYEGIAFMRASGANTLALVYPATATDAEPQTGETIEFETIRVEDMTISAFQVEVRGIASSGGFHRFSNGLGERLIDLIA